MEALKTMTITTRTLTLLSAVSLAAACSAEPKPSAPLAPKAPAHAAPAPASEPPRVIDPLTLAAAAPKPPESVLDRAPVQERALVEPKPVEVTPEELDFMHSEPGEVRAVKAAEVRVKRFVLSHDVKGREPVDEADVFDPATPKIFAFVELENGAEPYAVNVHFEPKDGPALPYGITLDVGTAPRFRTWAYTQIRRAPGSYRAVLRTLDGEDIASHDFEIAADD
jgi:hypothetical protein